MKKQPYLNEVLDFFSFSFFGLDFKFLVLSNVRGSSSASLTENHQTLNANKILSQEMCNFSSHLYKIVIIYHCI